MVSRTCVDLEGEDLLSNRMPGLASFPPVDERNASGEKVQTRREFAEFHFMSG